MHSLIRPAVATMPDYDEADLCDGDVRVRAHRNESALEAPAHVIGAVRGLDGGALRRYPVDRLHDVTSALSRRLGTTPERLTIGNGADDILAAVGRAVLDPTDVVVTVSPTFGMYARIASIAGADLRTLPYTRRWELDTEALLRLSSEAKLVVLGHPNNPTGDAIDGQTLMELAHALPRALIVIDEVYLSLSADSLVPRAASFPNVAVVGSFSKVAALAGMRIGYAVAHPLIACALRRVMLPFPVSVASLAAVDAYMREGTATAAFEATLTAQTRRSLDTLVDEVGCFAETAWRGCGNFVLMDFGPASAAIAQTLRSCGIAVRSFSEPELEGCLRFCALDDRGTSELVDAMRNACYSAGMRASRA
jgi:histidinol-phosphate aminotransferase